ncbi:hypothetical protein RHDC4_01624 [Rhodocyclaceae bacterium]|nr:hypothetical protein RHDC4_01624 [Rhodocyclaceae bacterium]
MNLRPLKLAILAALALLLAGCDLIALFDEQGKIDAKREAEGRAVGSACRHSGRALEECYERSPKTSKAAIYAGWRDMDAYMRENNIQVVSPDAPPEEVPPKAEAEDKPKAAEAPPADDKKKAAEAAPSAAPPPPVSPAVKPEKRVV